MKSIFGFVGAALMVVGCGTAMPPTDLRDARNAYGETTNGPATQYAADALLAARDALDRAEASFQQNGNDETTRTLAYVAARKAEIARAAGRIGRNEHELERARRDLAIVESDHLRSGARAPQNTTEALVFTAGALQRERLAEADTEHQAVTVVDDLRKVGHVTREPSGFVIALAPTNIFDGDGFAANASSELDAIALAIVRTSPTAGITVECHADTTDGGDLHDQLVAQKRANMIADYLAARGVAKSNVRPVGLAPKHVDPESAALHGIDRRIAIIVSPSLTAER